MAQKAIIKEIADTIKKKIKGGTLFGEPIDMNDMDMMIVASSMAARHEELEEHLHYAKIRRELASYHKNKGE